MNGDSIYEKKGRVRKPRVHITYEVQTDGAKERKELPFVVGVVGDFSGDPTEKLKPLTDREFVEIDRDNFDEVMARMKPGLNLRVENTLKGDGSEFGVQLKFEKMEDFEPGNIAKQVEPLRELLETRNKIKDLQSRLETSAELEEELEKILKSSKHLEDLGKELGITPAAPNSQNPLGSSGRPSNS
jgi:type VI secretion system protein ImpB